MLKNNPIFLMFLLVLVSQLHAQNDSLIIPISPDLEIGKLDNGLTYYLQQNQKPADIVELRMVVNTGSVMEDDDQLGLAHFLEHMAFNGTKSFEKNDIVSYLQSIGVEFGADLNAYTSFDETVYILPIPSAEFENLDKGFQILKEMMFDMTLHGDDIDAERGVVLEEYRTRLGAETRMLEKTLPAMMYGSKYVDRLPIGTKENLETFEHESLRRFYKDWYRPDLMGLIIVGDVEVEVMKDLMNKHFGDVPKSEVFREREVFPLPNHEDTKIAVASDPEAFVNRIQVMYKDRADRKEMKTVADYKSLLVDQLFSIMINARLNELANSSNPPFLSASSSYGGSYARSKNAYTSYGISPDGEKMPETLKAMLTENKRVLSHGFLYAELDRAKRSLLTRLENQAKEKNKVNSERIVSEYIRHFLENEAIPGIEWEFKTATELVPNIELVEVSTRISDFIHPDNMVVIASRKEDGEESLLDEDTIKAIIAEVDATKVAAYEEADLRSEIVESVPESGTIIDRSYDEKLDLTRLTLSNGVRVAYKQTNFKNDQVLVQAYSNGGTSLIDEDDLQKTLLALQLNANAQAGYGGLAVSEMEKVMSGNSASLSSSIGAFSENISGNSAPKDLKSLLELIYLHHTSLNKDMDYFNAYINNIKGFYAGILSNPEYYFQITVSEEKNRGNKRYLSFPSEEDFDAIDYDETYQFHVDRFADANDFSYYFIGNFEAKELESLVETYLASLPTKEQQDEIVVPEFRTKDEYREFIVEKGTDPKSFVNIQWTENLPYDAATRIAADALSNVLTNKLIEKLREDESGVYGVGARSNFQEIPYSQLSFNILFPCGPENARDLIDYSLELVEQIKKEGVSESDLNKVKESYRVDHKENLESNGYWIDYISTTDRYKKNPHRIFKYEERIDALKAEDLQRVAIDFLDENYFLALLMPEEIIEKVVEDVDESVEPKDVLANYIKAIGGTDKLNGIKSLQVTYVGDFMGNEIKADVLSTKDEMVQTVSMGGNVMATITVNASGAQVAQMGNTMDLPPDMAADMQANVGIIPEFRMMENESLAVTGIEDFEGIKAYAILTKGNTTTTTSYYAVESGLKIKQNVLIEMMGQVQSQDTSYGNYISFNGLLLPSTTSVPLGPQSVEATIRDVKINGEVVVAE
jgi:zinc protease